MYVCQSSDVNCLILPADVSTNFIPYLHNMPVANTENRITSSK